MTHFLMLLLDYALELNMLHLLYTIHKKKSFIISHHYKTVFYYNVFHSDLFGAWCCN